MGWALEPANFAWPDDLLRKSHAKGNKSGEIEEVLSDLEAAKKLHDAIGDFPFPPAKAAKNAAENWAANAVSFFAGGAFKKLLGSLKVILVRATKLQQQGKLGKDAKASVKTIIAALNDHINSVEHSVIDPQMMKIVHDLQEADKQYVLKNLKVLFVSYKACAAKKHPEIAEAANAVAGWSDDTGEQDQVRNAVHNKLNKACRDMTQNLQNLVKAMHYGGDLSGLEQRDITAIPKVAQSLVPIADAKKSVTEGMDRDQLIKLIRTVKVNADLYDEIAKRVP